MSNRDMCISVINPELAEKLINGKKTPLSECVPESGADW